MAKSMTVEILKQIRDNVAAVKTSVDELKVGVAQTNARLDQTNARLDRVEQGLLDLGQFMKQLALQFAQYERFHAHHVERLETDVDDLKARVKKLEERAAS